MKSFAKALLVSSSRRRLGRTEDAAAVGVEAIGKAGGERRLRGPTTVKSMRSRSTSRITAAVSNRSTGAVAMVRAMPALPGAQMTWVTPGSESEFGGERMLARAGAENEDPQGSKL